MAAKITSEGAKGAGSSRAALFRTLQTSGQPIPEPAAPRDVPEPLADLPPERVERGHGVRPKKKSLASVPETPRTSRPSKRRARIQAEG